MCVSFCHRFLVHFHRLDSLSKRLSLCLQDGLRLKLLEFQFPIKWNYFHPCRIFVPGICQKVLPSHFLLTLNCCKVHQFSFLVHQCPYNVLYFIQGNIQQLWSECCLQHLLLRYNKVIIICTFDRNNMNSNKKILTGFPFVVAIRI